MTVVVAFYSCNPKNQMEMLSTLTHKPIIGMVSGFGSGILLSAQHFFTDEKILPVVGAMGVWFGALVAGLTLVLKFIELTEKVISKYKRNKL